MAASAQPASALPIFAERYGFSCKVCHTAVPELNAFGNAFRRNGFVLPNVPRHRDFPLALRFQETYMKDLPQSATRRFNALAALVGEFNFGPDRSFSYFGRYFFGSQGAPGSLYYSYLQHVDARTGFFERAGLFNLPLIANATQRLDTITSQPAYTYEVGHNTANFADPRWGLIVGQRTAKLDAQVALLDDEYHGAAYGAPTPAGDLAESWIKPELFATVTGSVFRELQLGGLLLDGKRAFTSRTSGQTFTDSYEREGVQAEWTDGRFDLIGQQIWGHNSNADGFGTSEASSAGFATFKYRPTAHSYIGVRYDASANPFATRDWDFYAAFAPTPFARLVIEHVMPINQRGALQQTNVQLLLGLPHSAFTKT